jgi:hypothetical protein
MAKPFMKILPEMLRSQPPELAMFWREWLPVYWHNPMNLLVLQFCVSSRINRWYCVAKTGYQSFIASDVIANIGNAFWV